MINIEKHTIDAVFETARSNGASFVEIYAESAENTGVSLMNGNVENANSGLDYGCGIRVFDGLNAVYTYTNDLSKENLISITKKACEAIKNKSCFDKNIDLVLKPANDLSPIKIMPNEISKKRRVEILKSASNTAFEYSPKISQTRAGISEIVKNILIANSQGVFTTDSRVLTRFVLEAVASSETEKQSGYFAPGAQMGFEFFDTIDVESIAKEAASIALRMLNADYAKGGKFPVIIDNGFGGVLFHEACGHSLEATSVAFNQSVFSGRLGTKIASDIVTAFDDGTIGNAWGSINVDDEGHAPQKNLLIENGILKGYLIDKLNGKRMNMPSTGSARRASYKYAPTSRMTNTYIANGNSTFNEIIENTELALYCKQMGGGSVDPASGLFNFSVLEGYMVRNGKICEPVRGAALIGKGEEILKKIDMVADNLKHAQGMCGSVSGAIPTNVGQPTLRILDMTVGGR